MARAPIAAHGAERGKKRGERAREESSGTEREGAGERESVRALTL